MATRGQVERRAQALGCTVEINADRPGVFDGLDLTVSAPTGKVFKGSALHAVVGSQHAGESRAEVYASLIADMAEGLEECVEAECDACERYPDEQ